uniref:Iron sulphur domain-containing protein n=1 Tax=Glossina austeni TaxID=7395 RepID=A0A1A9VGC6_GLOAU
MTGTTGTASKLRQNDDVIELEKRLQMQRYYSESLEYIISNSDVTDWLSLVPPAVVAAVLGYTFYLGYCPEARKGCTPSGRSNQSVHSYTENRENFVNDPVNGLE